MQQKGLRMDNLNLKENYQTFLKRMICYILQEEVKDIDELLKKIDEDYKRVEKEFFKTW